MEESSRKLVTAGYRRTNFGLLEIGREIAYIYKDSYLRAIIIERDEDGGGTAEELSLQIMCCFNPNDVVYVKD